MTIDSGSASAGSPRVDPANNSDACSTTTPNAAPGQHPAFDVTLAGSQRIMLDTYSGKKLGLPSTHHAARDGSGVSVSTTNFYLAAGESDPAELIKSVKNGLFVTELIGFGVNGVTGDYSRGAVGIWIENGELAYPVEEITVAGNLLDMFRAVEGVGNDLVFRDRTAAPTLLIGRMVVAGV